MKSNYFLVFLIVIFLGKQTNVFGESKVEIIITSDNTAIVKGQNASQQETNIIHLLQQRIKDKTGVLVQVINEGDLNLKTTGFNTLIIAGKAKSSKLLADIIKIEGIIFPDKEGSFALITQEFKSKNTIIIAGADDLGVLYGEGKFLRTSKYVGKEMHVNSLKIAENPEDNSRGIYFAIHTGNWYEGNPDTEKVKDLIREQGLWGANILWMWFDLSMYHKSPFDKNSDSRNKWERIKLFAKAANDIGMKVGLVEIANASYLDQVNDTIKAIGGEPPEGLLCPHANNGEGLRIMERNYRDLYQDLKNNNINVDAVSLFLYDRGGCHCNLCKPFVETGVKYIGTSHAKVVKEYFSKCDFYLNDWHFEKHDGVNEVQWTKDFLKAEDPDWIRGIQRDERHAWDRWTGIDKKYEVVTFFDISMIGGWGSFGSNPFPGRLEKFFGGMRDNRIKGGLSYTEGIFDDINKVLVLQHHWGKYTSESILKEYAKWYFNADDKTQKTIADILAGMESEWSNIYGHQMSQSLFTKPQLNIKNRVDSLEALFPDNIKEMWRWKLIHSRVNLAKTAADISGLEGSGYDEFLAELNRLLSQEKVNMVDVNQLIKEKEKWLEQKLQLFDMEYKELYYSIYGGTKTGEYGNLAPNPAKYVKGFSKGEKWRAAFDKKVKP